MKIIVFSDSHFSVRNMQRVLEMHSDTIQYVFHLGDGCAEAALLRQNYPGICFVTVAGNYEDYRSENYVKETVIELCSYRFLLTHGHRYSVKSGLDHLIYHAEEKEADVVLFGHTHIKYKYYINNDNSKPLWVFNPGSISRPINGFPSYGIIEIRNGNILLTNAELKF